MTDLNILYNDSFTKAAGTSNIKAAIKHRVEGLAKRVRDSVNDVSEETKAKYKNIDFDLKYERSFVKLNDLGPIEIYFYVTSESAAVKANNPGLTFVAGATFLCYDLPSERRLDLWSKLLKRQFQASLIKAMEE